MAGVGHTAYSNAVKLIETADNDTLDALRRGDLTIDRAFKDMKAEQKRQDIAEKVATSPDR